MASTATLPSNSASPRSRSGNASTRCDPSQKRPARASRLGHREELPGSWHALQLVFTLVFELDSRPGDKVDQRPRDERLPSFGFGADTCAEVNGEPADVVPAQLDFTGMQ